MHQTGILCSLAVILSSAAAAAQLRSGDVFREYPWRPRTKWQRVTGPDATDPGAKQFLPNPVNRISLADLRAATRVVAYVEKLTSHAGTNAPRMRVNGKAWLSVPDPQPTAIPGKRGRGLPVNEYLTMRYPAVDIPLRQVRQGTNTFEFTCQGAGGSGLGKVWPQWLVYGVTFRVYYAATRAHPRGVITAPRGGDELGASPVFDVEVRSTTALRQVDLLGDYDDFDWRGDGLDGRWQYHYHYGAIRKHIGTARQGPWRVRWDTTWIPTQPRPFSVVARIVDTTGLCYITEAVTGLTLRRPRTVVRYRSFNIPKKWQSQKYAPKHSCENSVTDDLRKASAARLFLTTWNGYGAQEIGMNGRKLVTNIGKNHDLDYNTVDVRTGSIRAGKNTFYTYSRTPHHGIEVQWPGIELFVRYDVPESWAHYVPFGAGCRGSAGTPLLRGSGRPVLGRTLGIDLSRARANAPAALLTGGSNRRWGPILLPLDLRVAGAAGCYLLVTPDLAGPTASDASGRARLSWTVPNAAELAGRRFFHQFLVLDRAANALGYAFSNGAAATIGRR